MIRPLALALLLAAPATAQDVRPADRERLDGWLGHFGDAVKQAYAGGDPADLDQLRQAMDGEPGPLLPEGDWACRTMKLGEILPITVYTDFRCRITAAGDGTWRLEKLTGSQRTTGTITQTDEGALYLGVGYVAGGPAVDYAGLPPDSQEPVEPGQTHAQVGWFEQTAPDEARLLLPDPILESRFDILWLTR
ncbi:DUF4893 domain-containing protein [Wenxinia marina]|uniref:DUF4893 domain-containing protein n=1 Tax=Wenxinia marina DSM 24838 TaxID=1123501 RepID=A0A0D0Q6G8_9RHOB|nr:DUF4893 domain-containing protein [Wenxinia marina]KIQ68052.1 hypothetical protein Wenmar_03508 [Wenxinia marina DSM 24838]GGL75093.1 DUF4893 domain-containing protein [Wenxinia marina]